MTTHLQWITNIPTPYRNHRYEVMAEVFPRYDLSFEVLFMAWSEPDRHWDFETEDLRYPHTVFSGIHPRVSGVNLHFNPTLLSHVRRSEPDVVVVGGYSAPTLMAAPFAVPSTCLRLLGVESNLSGVTHTRGVVHHLKQALVRRYDGFVIPGPPSRAYVEALDSEASDKPFIILPNIIDGSSFVESNTDSERALTTRRRYGISEQTQLWLCAARLEDFKGLHLFLPLLENVDGVRLLIAGEGSQRERLQAMISSGNIPADLIGYVDSSTLRDLYAAADLFVLPSLRDPSPLSAVEATASKLPLVLTRRAGNAGDLIEEGLNGWLYDPDHSVEFRPTLKAIASKSRQELQSMGELSYARYEERFDSVRCIERLAEGIVEVAS